MTLLDRIADALSARAIPHALIGAIALAAHGVSRSTLDRDLLVTDPQVLDEDFWRAFPPPARELWALIVSGASS